MKETSADIMERMSNRIDLLEKHVDELMEFMERKNDELRALVMRYAQEVENHQD